MKKIILILGPNGVGKSTTAKVLLSKLLKAAYIDGDACRAINPFPFTKATKIAVMKNIYCMFRNYLLCEDIETVIFPYSFHGERKEIWETVLQKLEEDNIAFELHPIILECTREENIRRGKADNRDIKRIERGMQQTFSFYDAYTYPRIDTTNLTTEEVAESILRF